jgi:hypothetical protein
MRKQFSDPPVGSDRLIIMWESALAENNPSSRKSFLSILSIKCGNWFYWADRAETAERAESKESPVFMRI